MTKPSRPTTSVLVACGGLSLAAGAPPVADYLRGPDRPPLAAVSEQSVQLPPVGFGSATAAAWPAQSIRPRHAVPPGDAFTFHRGNLRR